MKTIITTLLYAITTLSSYAAVILSDVSYDINIQFEEDKYVEDWSYVPSTKTYYEVLEVTAEKAGTYNFYNYNSELYGLLGPTVDTQLLIYDVAPDFIIIDGPWAFNNGPGLGFGGGQENVSFLPFDIGLIESENDIMLDQPLVQTEQPNNGIFGNEAFDASITFSAGQSYTIVFSSFQPDAFGSMNVEIHGPSELGISAIPEPTTYALLAGFVAFLYIAIKKRK